MKKRISRWLISLAQRINPQVEQRNRYVARQVGIGIHISKKDVVNFRKLNPQYKSHRQGLNALIEDTKNKAIINIVAGLVQNNVVEYEVSKKLFSADVKAILKVYVPTEKEE